MIQDKVSNAVKDVKQVVDGVEQVIDGARQAVEESRKVYSTRLLLRGVLWVALYAVSLWLLRESALLTIESRPARIAIALMPVPFFGWWLFTWLKGVMRMDELQRRIELEALAFAFPASLVLLATIGLMDAAVGMDPADFSLRHVWLMMPMLYYIGLWHAQWRYA